MLSSQTVYLRNKNEELLNVLKENARHLNRKVEICSELLRGKPRYCEKEFTECRPKSPEMSSVGKFNRRDGVHQPVRTLHATSPLRSTSAGRRRNTSAERLRSPRRGHSTCVPSQPISHGSSSDNRWSKLQQDLASHAHMHGYTLSHALSKCYCTRKEGSDTVTSFTGSSRMVAEPFVRKTRIPPRLKEKRYHANSPKRKSCSVKWAVPSGRKIADQLPEDNFNLVLSSEDCDQENNQKQSASLCTSPCAQGDAPVKMRSPAVHELNSENDSDWFVKMKNFRKSNWFDCHAPEHQNEEKSDCKCNRLFMIGERMFLQPVNGSVLNSDCWCLGARKGVTIPSPQDTVITLPRVPTEVRKKPQKSKEANTVSNRRTGCSSGTYDINGPCFLTGHKTKHDDDQIRAFVLQRPPDSFALRYQKGIDPRKP